MIVFRHVHVACWYAISFGIGFVFSQTLTIKRQLISMSFFLLLWSNRYLIYFQRLSKMMEPVSYLKYMVHCVVWLGLLKGVNVINSLADFHYLISYVFFSTQQYFTRHVVCEIKQHRTYITYWNPCLCCYVYSAIYTS